MTKYNITKTDSADDKTVIASGLSLVAMIDALQLHAGENGTFDSNTLSARDTQGNLFLAWPLN